MAPVLVLINGIPASGKTTVARAWCAEHAQGLPLALDVDVLRSMLGGWQGARAEAGLAARALAIAAIRTQLGAGRDVLVPQYLRRTAFIEDLRQAAELSGAVFIECALIIEPREASERFDRRGAVGDQHGDLEAPMATVAAEFEEFLAARPHVLRVDALNDPVAALDEIIESRR